MEIFYECPECGAVWTEQQALESSDGLLFCPECYTQKQLDSEDAPDELRSNYLYPLVKDIVIAVVKYNDAMQDLLLLSYIDGICTGWRELKNTLYLNEHWDIAGAPRKPGVYRCNIAVTREVGSETLQIRGWHKICDL